MYEDYDYDRVGENNTQQRPQIDPATKARIEKKAAKKAARKKWWMCIAYALVFGIIAGCTIQGISIAGGVIKNKLGLNDNKAVQSESKAADEEKPADEGKSAPEEKPEPKEVKKNEAKSEPDTVVAATYDVSQVAADVMPSVVSITNKSIQEVRMMFGYGVQQYEATSCGSGIIMDQNDDELLIVTNNHVIEDAETLTVGFVNDDVIEAVVKGKDVDNDLAVVAVKKSDISDETMEKISIATAGDSDKLVIGEPVVAIGNAMGYGQSVTSGIVSALDREFMEENFEGTLIQTDAAINPGNSGGALLNMQGEVIGINSAKINASVAEGMGYAIPISYAKPILDDLMNRETRDMVDANKQGYLGISSTVELTKEYSEAMGIPTGVYVTEVTDGSPAKKAGIIKGDVIKKFDNVSVSSISDLKNLMQYYSVGEKVDVLILRSDEGEYKEKTITVTLGDRKGTALDPEKSSEGNQEYDAEPEEKEEDNQPNPRQDDNDDYYNGGFFDPFDIFNYFN